MGLVPSMLKTSPLTRNFDIGNESIESLYVFRELLNKMEVFVRQIRQCASSHSDGVSTAEQKILPEAEQTIRSIMQLVHR